MQVCVLFEQVQCVISQSNKNLHPVLTVGNTTTWVATDGLLQWHLLAWGTLCTPLGHSMAMGHGQCALCAVPKHETAMKLK